jgi:putative DNA primase/helicase
MKRSAPGTAGNCGAAMNAISRNCKVALYCAREGLAVFPCKQDKSPLVPSWPSTATTDQQQIATWWQARPEALVGLPLKQKDWLVIDADRHNPTEDGVARWHALCEGKELPPHPIVLTANNGEHRYFKQPPGEKIGNKKIDIGLETRGFKTDNDGGYVIAMGSMLPDGRRWKPMEGAPSLFAMLKNGGLPEAPTWLIDLINPRPKVSAPAPIARDNSNREKAYASKALDNCTAELARAQPGERNNVLNTAAFKMGTMVARGWIEKSTVVEALWGACDGNGLVRDDGTDSVQKTLASGLNAGLDRPHDNVRDRPLTNGAGRERLESGGEKQDGRRLDSRRASEITPRDIEFLWDGRLAIGKHSCIGGEPGSGKSQLSFAIAAAITTGGEWPCSQDRAPIGNVIILNAEDDADDMIVPRLLAAGANRERIYIISAVTGRDGKGQTTFNLQLDLDLLEKKLDEIGDVALVIIDPISSYMGKADSHKNSDVRGVLEPISEMAGRKRTAILSVTHFSKSNAGTTTKALHRFIGSIAFVGAPRAAFAVIEDPDNEGRMLFLHAKNNMGAKPQGLAFRLVQILLEGLTRPVSYVVWDSEPVNMTANEAMAASDEDCTALDEVTDFLRDELKAGPVEADIIRSQAKRAGIADRTLKRARAKLGVISRREGFGRDGKFFLELPIEGQKPP